MVVGKDYCMNTKAVIEAENYHKGSYKLTPTEDLRDIQFPAVVASGETINQAAETFPVWC